MFKHFCTFGNRFFLRFAAQNSICFALPTSLFHRAAGQATRWNKSLGPPRLHSRSCFFMSVGFRKNIWFGSYFLQAFLQFLAANLSGLRRSTYSGCSSKLSLQTVRGCGDGTPRASSINYLEKAEHLAQCLWCQGWLSLPASTRPRKNRLKTSSVTNPSIAAEGRTRGTALS